MKVSYMICPKYATHLILTLVYYFGSGNDLRPAHPGCILIHQLEREVQQSFSKGDLAGSLDTQRGCYGSPDATLTWETECSLGDHVFQQNEQGPHAIKWDKSGTAVERRDYDQWWVKVDGHGCLTLCDACFLRKFSPATVLIPVLKGYNDVQLYRQISIYM